MSKIIKLFEQHTNCDDVLHMIYGISSNEYFDCVFVVPHWDIYKVFTDSDVSIELFAKTDDTTAYEIKHNGKRYLYIVLSMGAPNIIDFCLACHKLNCDKYVFLGSVGSLVPEIRIGDFIIPEYSISGDGASLYLNDTLDTSNMFKPAYSDATLSKRIKDICVSQNITVADGTPISVDSIFCEYAHLNEFITMGANAIEMESAAFFKAMKYINKPAAAVLVVSDNTSANQPLMGKDDTTRTKYRNARQNAQKILKQI
jgi:purine-nucleoside phosphorylase